MTINVEAIQSLSRGQLRGNLYTSDDKHILSSERMIPFISDVGDAKGTYVVNGHTISDVCRKNISTAELNIVFLCESQVSPCLIEISTDDSNETSQGVGHATWNKKYISLTEVNVLIKYGACNLSVIFQTVSCNFNINNVSSTKEISCSNIAIPWTLVAVLAASVVILTSVLIFKFKRRILQIFEKSDPHGTASPMNGIGCSHSSDSEACGFLDERHEQDDGHQKEICIDSEMGHSSRVSYSKSARKRHIDTYEACTASEPQQLMHDFTSCKKNEKHERFIPIDTFTKAHLQHHFGKIDLFGLIKCIAELTVMIIVNYVSYQRPEFYPGTERTYPFHEKRGTYVVRFGTGLVKSVIQTEDGQPCPCHKCLHYGNASKEWGKICIATSKSLVFDDSEAQKTTFKINFNEENGRYHFAEGTNVTQSDIHTDQCEVECVTCDEGLLNLLYSKPNTCLQKMADVNSTYNKFKDKKKLAIIVSHPHGCPKHVSIGHWIKRRVVGNDGSRHYTKYVYTTPTCPGCMGAFVYILGASNMSLKHHVHCGVNEDMNNFSNTGMETMGMKPLKAKT